MQFSIQWAGVSITYVGIAFGAVMGWRASADEGSPAWRAIAPIFGAFFAGGATIPFMASNFVAAAMAMWLARANTFAAQFATFAALSLTLGWLILRILDEGLRSMGGLHLDVEMPKYLAMAVAAFAVALLLMRFAPVQRPA